jgi:1,4-dihydroxy-6-naphthoate synthase
MKLSLGFSPCPNDTFIFDALVNNQINSEGFEFDVVLEDVQTLNRWAMEGRLDVSKISYGVWPLLQQQYFLLESGGALGKGVGPLLIARSPLEIDTIHEKTIAIPGENTTAHLLFSLAFPSAKQKRFTVFNEIEDAVVKGEVDAGVIIHENRFTYQEKGLYKIIDLGDYWETKMQLPIPLGGIVARKNLDKKTIHQIDNLIKESVAFAFKNNHAKLSDYVKAHAQEMSETVMRQHIDLYVNNFSAGLGNDGRMAVEKLVEVYNNMHSDDEVH